jgi:hypothetical protein
VQDIMALNNKGTDHCWAGVNWILVVSWLSTMTVLGTAETRRMFQRASAQEASIQTTERPRSDCGIVGALEAAEGTPERNIGGWRRGREEEGQACLTGLENSETSWAHHRYIIDT